MTSNVQGIGGDRKSEHTTFTSLVPVFHEFSNSKMKNVQKLTTLVKFVVTKLIFESYFFHLPHKSKIFFVSVAFSRTDFKKRPFI